ncbi:MAG: endolytic transglycosylase MltG [Bacteroidales bacterium]|nr:endolytic transglycosylase MltG [Bacteroidales bacterium]
MSKKIKKSRKGSTGKSGLKKGKKITIISILSALVILGGAFALGYYCNFQSDNVNEKGVIYISKTYDYQDVINVVDSCGILKNSKYFRNAASLMKLEEGFKAGRYELEPGMNNKYIVRMIANGWQKPTNIVISGYIRSFEKFAAILGSKFDADSAEFSNSLNNIALRDSLGFKKEDYISMFIPNTYEFYWTTTPKDFILRMKKEWDNFWNEDRDAKAKKLNMSRSEVSTLASIVIEESKYVPEQPTIAGVYLNRIRKGIPLQADPTVLFALGDPRPNRVLKKHLQVDSPYNTYKHKGLPPGPITMAPISAIDAVLNYEKHNYIYFCAKPTFDGQHSFASSYSQHLKNARAYHKALTKRLKERENQ